MIFAFIRSLLGEFGRAILDFYIENSLLINSIIVVYGICVVFAHRSYTLTLEKIKNILGVENEIGSEKINKLIDKSKMDWEEVHSVSRFPFIAIPGRIWLQIRNTDTLQRLFSHENLLKLFVEQKTKQKEK